MYYKLIISAIVVSVVALRLPFCNGGKSIFYDGLYEALSEKWDEDWRGFEKIEKAYGRRKTLPPIDWSNIVLMMDIQASWWKSNPLIEAHLNTWLKSVGRDAILIFLLHPDDNTNQNKINDAGLEASVEFLRLTDADAEIFLGYKKLALFDHVRKNLSAGKKYFLSVDVETYVRPDRLFTYLNNLHTQTYPKPVHFGSAVCVWFCYTEGSLFGFNDAGFFTFLDFFENHYSNSLEVHSAYLQDNAGNMWNEDFMISYVYKKATQFLMIHNPLFYTFKGDEKALSFQIDTISTRYNGISFNPLMNPEIFYHVHNITWPIL